MQLYTLFNIIQHLYPAALSELVVQSADITEVMGLICNEHTGLEMGVPCAALEDLDYAK